VLRHCLLRPVTHLHRHPLLLLPCALTRAVAAVFTSQRNAPMAQLPGLLPP
jgi:hypothetical protein